MDRLPALAAELVQRQVAVIVTSGGDVSAQEPKRRRRRFRCLNHRRRSGQGGARCEFNRPGGNLTGATFCLHIRLLSGSSCYTNSFPKPSQSWHSLIQAIQLLLDPGAVLAASKTFGLQLRFVNAGTVRELETAFETVDRDRPDGC